MFRAAQKTYLIANLALAATLVACSGAAPAPGSQPPTAATTIQPTQAPTNNATLPSATSTPRVTVKPSPTLDPKSVGYRDLPGWIVFEHFGQAPDGSTPEFDFNYRTLWLVHANGNDLHELAPGNPTDGKVSPDISPDGATVAFAGWDPMRVWTVPIEGGEPTMISTDCDGTHTCLEYDPAFSADGTKLALVHSEVIDGTTYSQIGVRDLAGGELSLLDETRVDEAEQYLGQPSWSPDGQEIVYYRASKTPIQERPTHISLLVTKADDSGVRELPTPTGEWAADPDWSPDGSTILFNSAPNRETEGWSLDDFPGHAGVWTIQPDGSDMTKLGVGWAASWAPDGDRIIMWGDLTFALMDADGRNEAQINKPELTWYGEGLGYGYAGYLAPTN